MLPAANPIRKRGRADSAYDDDRLMPLIEYISLNIHLVLAFFFRDAMSFSVSLLSINDIPAVIKRTMNSAGLNLS